MKNSIKILTLVFIFTLYSTQFGLAQNKVSCLALSSDLSLGNTDSNSSGPVTSLQKYLVDRGYLSVAPNGHFGPSTKAAVKALQIANKISPTGTVGPATRAVIQKRSCSSTGVTSPTVNLVTTPGNTVTVINPNPASPAISMTPPAATTTTTNIHASILSPNSGDVLAIGKTYNISWNTPLNYPYNIILEQVGGAGAGLIQTSGFGTSSFQWKVGNIYSSSINANENVATGTYRIHIESTSYTPSDSDPVSGWFTLTSPALSVRSISPATVPADNLTAAVILGVGFDSSTKVHFDGQYGYPANVLYVSPDGTIIVFTVPTNIQIGLHTIWVSNQYSSVTSNTANLSVLVAP